MIFRIRRKKNVRVWVRMWLPATSVVITRTVVIMRSSVVSSSPFPHFSGFDPLGQLCHLLFQLA